MTSPAEHTVFITNDFPPRAGGIQTFVYELVRRFAPDAVTVVTSAHDGDAEFDLTQPYRIVRSRSTVLLPTSATFKLVRQVIAETGATRVVFGAAAPLALMAPKLRPLGVTKIVALTHGHEVGWARTPITSAAIRKIGSSVDVLTYLGEYTKTRIASALRPEDQSKLVKLAPAVDPLLFNPSNLAAGRQLRADIGFADRPTLVCVSRLMARKGQDALIEALPAIARQVPDVALVIVGDGPYRPALEKKVRELGLTNSVHFAGRVEYQKLPAWYLTGDVFVMPCRTRNAGWDVEGLGIVYLEASASGLPVIAGDSGGAPDAVLPNQTGLVVSGTDQAQIVSSCSRLLLDAPLRNQMGQTGRIWVEQHWTWDAAAQTLHKLLE
ncbi:MAG: glycosyltransferase family 4 protein [Actinomycetales bacterium]|nr:glycosyltransferase family 4 protein [Actinomycetales bacterium]